MSFMCKIRPEHEVVYEAGSSSKMLKKHYRRAVSQAESDAYWGCTPESLGLISGEKQESQPASH
jgi:hypothetical protein